MKYILITGFKNGESQDVYDTYAEAYEEMSESVVHTTKEEMKNSYWFICEVSDEYAESLDDEDNDDVEYVMDIYDPVFSYIGTIR